MDRKILKELTQEVLKRTEIEISEEDLECFIIDFLKKTKSENLLEDSFFFMFLVNEIITDLEN